MRRTGEPCEIEDRICTECGECDTCERDPAKVCDNCCECLNEPDTDFLAIEIEGILLDTEDIKKSKMSVNRYNVKQRNRK